MMLRTWRRTRSVLLLVVLGVGLLAMHNVRTDAPSNYAASPWLTDPPAAFTEPVTLKLVTFNIADGYLFTTNRRERMRAIGELLTQLDPDLVGLQESFVESDREVLLEALAGSRLQHHVRFPGALVGNGLLIVSAWPIEEAYFHRFENDGSWFRIWEGDWWAGKGVGLARVRLPNGAFVDFYDTHAQAGRANPTNEWVRIGQLAELARFIDESRIPSMPAFVVGDFNTRPGAPDYELVVREANLARAMNQPSEIDHIFEIRSPHYETRVLDTQELGGTTQGSGPAFFLARAPGFSELWGLAFGSPEKTALSDHPGYLATVEIRPVAAGE